jgi:hypothetical protein
MRGFSSCEVLDQHVADLDQRLQHLLALRVLGVDGDRAFVAVQHREIEAVDPGDVPELAAGDIADSRPLDLDDVGTQPGEELGAGRARLDMGEVQDAYVVECLHRTVPLLSARRKNRATSCEACFAG